MSRARPVLGEKVLLNTGPSDVYWWCKTGVKTGVKSQ